jgi:hypothetical protein
VTPTLYSRGRAAEMRKKMVSTRRLSREKPMRSRLRPERASRE